MGQGMTKLNMKIGLQPGENHQNLPTTKRNKKNRTFKEK